MKHKEMDFVMDNVVLLFFGGLYFAFLEFYMLPFIAEISKWIKYYWSLM